MRKKRAFIVTLLIITYLLGITPRQAAFAQEATPTPDPSASSSPSPSPDTTSTPTPTPTPSPTPDPSVLPSPSPSPAATTAVVDPSPTPTPSPSPTPCPTGCDATPAGTVDQTNTAATTNTASSTSDTGNNVINPSPSPSPDPSPSPSPEASPEATGSAAPQTGSDSSNNQNSDGNNPTTQGSTGTTGTTTPSAAPTTVLTGDAAAQVNVVNLANTNTANSTQAFDVKNIFGNVTGNVILIDSTSTVPNPSLLLVNQTNTAEVNNVITALANSGYNLVNGATGQITTGTAYAIVNIFNFVNANIANSSFSIALVNIFGNLTGNIQLPTPQTTTTSANPDPAVGQVSQTNTATVANNVTQNANTGNNQTGGGTIQTGDAAALTNIQNYVNSNLLGGSFYHLIINNFGNWNGQFVGWGALGPQNPQYGSMVFDINTPPAFAALGGTSTVGQVNTATVTNSVTANANTGGNTISSYGNVQTGNAFSAVNIVNFINSNIVNGHGFFGMINIFGSLNGNIGGADQLNPPAPEVASQTQTSNASDDVKVPGGQLQTTISTNVGTHVNSGDTVMFFINAKNPGTGPVYDSKVVFNLYDSNGEIGAIQTFNIGKLDAGKTAKISFGLVLSNKAPGGTYTALAQASGKIGPNDWTIESDTQTSFLVSNLNALLLAPPASTPEQPLVLGSKINNNAPVYGSKYYNYEGWWGLFLLLFFTTYIYSLHKLYKKSDEILA